MLEALEAALPMAPETPESEVPQSVLLFVPQPMPQSEPPSLPPKSVPLMVLQSVTHTAPQLVPL